MAMVQRVQSVAAHGPPELFADAAGRSDLQHHARSRREVHGVSAFVDDESIGHQLHERPSSCVTDVRGLQDPRLLRLVHPERVER